MGSATMLTIAILSLLLTTAIAQIIYGTYWFNDDQKRRIIQMHNQLRAAEPAANMQELVWDDRLAALAHGHVQRCDAWHRSAYERRGYGYSYIGENIWWSNEGFLRSNIESTVVDFFNEKPFYDFATTGCWGSQCGHYTQVVWATTCAVGCAAVHCEGIRNGRGIYSGHILVCNYGEGGNLYGHRPYIVGPRCSQCPGGGGCTSEGLCAPMCYGIRFPRFFYQQPTRQHVILKRTNQFQTKTTSANKAIQTTKADLLRQRQTAAKHFKTYTTSSKNECHDSYHECANWAQNGRCRGNNSRFMVQYCRRSCRLCNNNRTI